MESTARKERGGRVTYAAALTFARAALRDAGVASAALDARLLAGAAFDFSPEELILRGREFADDEGLKRLYGLIERRVRGEPVSKILGRREFFGLSFLVTPDVLDPRPESELLIEACLDYVDNHGLREAPMRVLDLGTGSGCLLCALLHELPEAIGVGIDISMAALSVAQKNINALGLNGRAFLLCGNWANALRSSSFDVAVCNPPYIKSAEIEKLDPSVRDFDPKIALDGGVNGLEAYRQVIPQMLRVLKDTGLATWEAGRDQAHQIEQVLRAQAVSDIRIWPDLAGVPRVVAAKRQFRSESGDRKKKVGFLA